MKTSTFVAAALTAGSAVSAVPVKRELNFGGLGGPLGSLLSGPLAPLGDSAQAAVAELFKAGDVILNIPGDVPRKMLEGDPIGAVTGLVQNLLKTGADIPKDAMSILGPLAKPLIPGGQNGQNSNAGQQKQAQQNQPQQNQPPQNQSAREQQIADYQKQVDEAIARAEQEAKTLSAQGQQGQQGHDDQQAQQGQQGQQGQENQQGQQGQEGQEGQQGQVDAQN